MNHRAPFLPNRVKVRKRKVRKRKMVPHVSGKDRHIPLLVAAGVGGVAGAAVLGPVGAAIGTKVSTLAAVKFVVGAVGVGVGAAGGSCGVEKAVFAETSCRRNSVLASVGPWVELQPLQHFGEEKSCNTHNLKGAIEEVLVSLQNSQTSCDDLVQQLETVFNEHLLSLTMSQWSHAITRTLRLCDERARRMMGTTTQEMLLSCCTTETVVHKIEEIAVLLSDFLYRVFWLLIEDVTNIINSSNGSEVSQYIFGKDLKDLAQTACFRASATALYQQTNCLNLVMQLIELKSTLSPKAIAANDMLHEVHQMRKPMYLRKQETMCVSCKRHLRTKSDCASKARGEMTQLRKYLFHTASSSLKLVELQCSPFVKLEQFHYAFKLVTLLAALHTGCSYCERQQLLINAIDSSADPFRKCIHYSANELKFPDNQTECTENQSNAANLDVAVVANDLIDKQLNVETLSAKVAKLMDNTIPLKVGLDELLPVACEVGLSSKLAQPLWELEVVAKLTQVVDEPDDLVWTNALNGYGAGAGETKYAFVTWEAAFTALNEIGITSLVQ